MTIKKYSQLLLMVCLVAVAKVSTARDLAGAASTVGESRLQQSSLLATGNVSSDLPTTTTAVRPFTVGLGLGVEYAILGAKLNLNRDRAGAFLSLGPLGFSTGIQIFDPRRRLSVDLMFARWSIYEGDDEKVVLKGIGLSSHKKLKSNGIFSAGLALTSYKDDCSGCNESTGLGLSIGYEF